MWKVRNWLSTRKDGTVECQEFLSWAPGDVPGEDGIPDFPSWVPLDEWEHAGYIQKIEDPVDQKALRSKKEVTRGG